MEEVSMPDPVGNPEVSARPEGHIARLEILSAVHRSRWLRASNSGAASKSSSSIGKLGHPRNVFFTSIPTFWGIWGSGRISFRRALQLRAEWFLTPLVLYRSCRNAMADDIDEPLAEGWEAVVDDTGRTYWWNTETNETTWTKPVAVLAKRGLAAGAAQHERTRPSSSPLAARALHAPWPPLRSQPARSLQAISARLAATSPRGPACTTTSRCSGEAAPHG